MAFIDAHRKELGIDDEAALLRRAARDHAASVALPMPDRFVGYRLVPQEVEFWAASSDRLHKRLAYPRRSRSKLLCRPETPRYGGVTQTKLPPENPERFRS